jgi:hypothetical protein
MVSRAATTIMNGVRETRLIHRPGSYIRDMRLERAVTMLCQTDRRTARGPSATICARSSSLKASSTAA